MPGMAPPTQTSVTCGLGEGTIYRPSGSDGRTCIFLQGLIARLFPVPMLRQSRLAPGSVLASALSSAYKSSSSY
jgi:hypothetical protein